VELTSWCLGLAGLEVWDLNKEGSRLAWVTRPTLTVDASTVLVDTQGLSAGNQQLLKQKGAAFENQQVDTGRKLSEMFPQSAC
jgi:hypothetical protein